MVGLDNPLHIAFLLLIVLLVFGAKRLPEMGRSLGAGLRGFKETVSGETPSEQPTRMAASTSPDLAAEPVSSTQEANPAAEPVESQRAA